MTHDNISIEEMHNMIAMMKASIVGFHLDPDKASGTWHAVLRKYSKKELWIAVKSILANTNDRPTPKAIKIHCDANRRNVASEQYFRSLDGQSKKADESFEGVPGKNRLEQIVWVQGDQAAINWRAGKREPYFAYLLSKAAQFGFRFDGVDYAEVETKSREFGNDFGLGQLAAMAQRGF